MKGRIKDMGFGLGGELSVTLALPRHHAQEIQDLLDTDVSVEMKKWRNRRSRDANALCWVICRELGQHNGESPEDVYRRNIREIGHFVPLPIKESGVEEFQRQWASGHTGWFVDVLDDSKLDGYKLVRAYYGSSTYDTRQMSLLIDNLLQDAKASGLTLSASPKEIEEAKRRWGDA